LFKKNFSIPAIQRISSATSGYFGAETQIIANRDFNGPITFESDSQCAIILHESE